LIITKNIFVDILIDISLLSWWSSIRSSRI